MLWVSVAAGALVLWLSARARRGGTRAALHEGAVYVGAIGVGYLIYVVAQVLRQLSMVATAFGKAAEPARMVTLGDVLHGVFLGAAIGLVGVTMPLLSFASLLLRLARLPREP